jgi:phage tail-like protein
MDVNGLRFWSLSRKDDWFGNRINAHDVQWCPHQQTLRLVTQSQAPQLTEEPGLAMKLRLAPSPVADGFENLVQWDDARKALLPKGDTTVAHAVLNGGNTPLDLAFGDDDILYVARDGHIELVDTRDRFKPKQVSLDGFACNRLAPASGGGVYVLDTAQGWVARLTGKPLQEGLFPPNPTREFAPVIENPAPPSLQRLPIDPLQHTQAIAVSSQGRLAVLCVDGTNDAKIFIMDAATVTSELELQGLKQPAGLAWVGEDEIAILATDATTLAAHALVYAVDTSGSVLPNGRHYPLVDPALSGFVNSRSMHPCYTGADGSLRTLIPISSVSYARTGTVELAIDSGSAETVWHRLYVEAMIPPGCQVIAAVGATDRLVFPVELSDHVFGGNPVAGKPSAAWLDAASELPHTNGLLQVERVPGQTGLFSILIQKSSGNTRRFVGRHLRLTLHLYGNTHQSPEIAGVRAYASRFSYRDHYLPHLYREAFETDVAGPKSTGADYLERFLSLIEEPFTILEGKIAESHLLTTAAATPASALPWLAQWIGVDMPPGVATARERERLKAAPYTARLHGTLAGLRAAIELETGGLFVENPRLNADELPPNPGDVAQVLAGGKSVNGLFLSNGTGATAMLAGGKISSGSIVILEGFRMRRTFATILGANLADEDDELTGGLSVSGNSFVGDTLFLGAEYNKDVLALFADTPSASDQASVLEFFDKLAFRVTVLVHETATPQELARLQRIADAESPAHVEVNVVKARYPFLVGAGALIGVDTFLVEPASRENFKLGWSQLGTSDIVENQGLLVRNAGGVRL